MNRLCIQTRGIGSWHERLGNPDVQWKRGCSAFETAVSWEKADRTGSGVPDLIAALFQVKPYESTELLVAIAEHKVQLAGHGGASQCDVWAVLRSQVGLVSLSVEAKANESFGDHSLDDWLSGGKSERSVTNREDRWRFVASHLPPECDYSGVRFQILHRCAAAVIEARRLGLTYAAFVVQAFNAPTKSFDEYVKFCDALGVVSARGQLVTAPALQDVSLAIGWADCPLSSDRDVAMCA